MTTWYKSVVYGALWYWGKHLHRVTEQRVDKHTCIIYKTLIYDTVGLPIYGLFKNGLRVIVYMENNEISISCCTQL